MHMGSSMIVAIWLLLTVLALEPIFAEDDVEIMGRATRPKVFTNINELKEYLDFVQDFYAAKGKARYGKRSGNPQVNIDRHGYSLESLGQKLNILEQAYEEILAKKQNQNLQQQYLRERYPGECNKLRKPVQFGAAQLSGNYRKSDEKHQ